MKTIDPVKVKFVTKSSEDPAQKYTTKLYESGHSHCTCEGFRYRETCKHVDALVAMTDAQHVIQVHKVGPPKRDPAYPYRWETQKVQVSEGDIVVILSSPSTLAGRKF